MNHAPTDLSASDKSFLLSLNLSDPKDCERYSKWLTEQDRKRGIRTASAGELRTGIHYEEDGMKTLSDRGTGQDSITTKHSAHGPDPTKRHTPEDQRHLDAAALHLNAAGASGDTTTAADLARAHADAIRDMSAGTAADRYKATLSSEFDALRAETRALEAHAKTHVPKMRALEALDDVPNPYTSPASLRAAEIADVLDPTSDPNYQPFGRAADSYAIHLKLRQVLREDTAS